jgi:hypothetical protein
MVAKSEQIKKSEILNITVAPTIPSISEESNVLPGIASNRFHDLIIEHPKALICKEIDKSIIIKKQKSKSVTLTSFELDQALSNSSALDFMFMHAGKELIQLLPNYDSASETNIP